MTTVASATPARRRPTARTFEGRQRQRIHALKRTLGYSEAEYRTMLSALSSSTHASELGRDELMHVVDKLSEFALARRRTEQPTPETGLDQYEREQDELIEMLAVA